MTEVEAQKLVTVLVTAWPTSFARLDANQRTDTMRLYREMIADLDYAAANAAVKRLIASSRFLPTVAEIRESAIQADCGPQRAGGEAWGDVLAAVHRFGVYRSPAFADPLVARAVSALGWEEICNSENQAADRARFVELYEKLTVTERRELAMPADVRRLPEPRAGRAISFGDALKALGNGGDS